MDTRIDGCIRDDFKINPFMHVIKRLSRFSLYISSLFFGVEMKNVQKISATKTRSILPEQRDWNLTNLSVASSAYCVNAELLPNLVPIGIKKKTPNLGRCRFSCVSFCIRMHVHNAIMQHLPPRILSHALPALYDSLHF